MLIGPHSSRGAARRRCATRCCADPRNYIAQPVLGALDRALLHRRRDRAAARRSAALRAVRRQGHHRARRADPGGAAQGLAGGQFVAGRRLEGHLGPAELTPMLSRVADSLYWMSRYFERADNCARVIDATHSLMLSRVEVAADQRWYRALTQLGLPAGRRQPRSAGCDPPPRRRPVESRLDGRLPRRRRATTPRRCARRSAPRCGSSSIACTTRRSASASTSKTTSR